MNSLILPEVTTLHQLKPGNPELLSPGFFFNAAEDIPLHLTAHKLE